MRLSNSKAIADQFRLVVISKHLDVWELLSLAMVGGLLFLFGVEFGRTCSDPSEASRVRAGVYGRFGDMKQHSGLKLTVKLIPQ
jgi:hypothetical protein